jgi:hypothetical protein
MGKRNLILIYAVVLIFLAGIISAARLPTVGGDADAWGTVLNAFLQSLNSTAGIQSLINDTDISFNSIGIGTSTPAYSLEINQSATAMNVSGLMYVNSSNVGIGTGNPTATLEIMNRTGINELNVSGVFLVNSTKLSLIMTNLNFIKWGTGSTGSIWVGRNRVRLFEISRGKHRSSSFKRTKCWNWSICSRI